MLPTCGLCRHAGLQPGVSPRRPALRCPAHWPPCEQIADYDVVYNIYDRGLNDANRQPHLGPILFHEPVEHYAEGADS